LNEQEKLVVLEEKLKKEKKILDELKRKQDREDNREKSDE
jgi:heme exporter protein D